MASIQMTASEEAEDWWMVKDRLSWQSFENTGCLEQARINKTQVECALFGVSDFASLHLLTADAELREAKERACGLGELPRELTSDEKYILYEAFVILICRMKFWECADAKIFLHFMYSTWWLSVAFLNTLPLEIPGSLRCSSQNEMQLKAAEFLESAANQGRPDAQVLIARHFIAGHWVARNFAKACCWLRKAANQERTAAWNGICESYKTKASTLLAESKKVELGGSGGSEEKTFEQSVSEQLGGEVGRWQERWTCRGRDRDDDEEEEEEDSGDDDDLEEGGGGGGGGAHPPSKKKKEEDLEGELEDDYEGDSEEDEEVGGGGGGGGGSSPKERKKKKHDEDEEGGEVEEEEDDDWEEEEEEEGGEVGSKLRTLGNRVWTLDGMFERARGGNVHAQMFLGQALIQGRYGLKVDEAMAVEWFEKAAEGGDTEAQNVVAVAYCYGNMGLEVDEEKTLIYLRASADAGDIGGQRMLAVAFRDGELGLEVDKEKAAELFQKAREGGDSEIPLDL